MILLRLWAMAAHAEGLERFQLIQAAYAWKARRKIKRRAVLQCLCADPFAVPAGVDASGLLRGLVAEGIQDDMDMANGAAVACSVEAAKEEGV